MLVEDDEISRLFGTIALKKKGYDVITAENGQEAINMTSQGLFDLIFMDINMPVVDGFSAAVEIRKSEDCRTPIIAMTAYTMKADREKCIQAGMDDFIAKPVDLRELYSKIDKWLK